MTEAERLIEHQREQISTLRSSLALAQAGAAQMLALLRDANEKCRSAHHVAEAYLKADRTSAETNWRALRDQLRESLERQQPVLCDSAPGREFLAAFDGMVKVLPLARDWVVKTKAQLPVCERPPLRLGVLALGRHQGRLPMKRKRKAWPTVIEVRMLALFLYEAWKGGG